MSHLHLFFRDGYNRCHSLSVPTGPQLLEQTLDDIEFLTGIDSSDINKYELGKINLTMKTLIKLSSALKVKPKDLLDFKFNFEKYDTEKS
ncbi:XRE family transcriptional regulator [Chryseobacterium daecheongense]|uniref:XRE family transcriptional regulator n=1 Tax=Chryseobacterium daecheongense TaxID=192389 RepID=A0A3N0VYN0_9FLAO|nr:XRE family transcriptional regulator [Chryseobacterium daecheongense]